MFYHIFDIANILGGILLAIHILGSWDAVSEFFHQVADWVAQYAFIIGLISFLFGIVLLLRPGCAIHDLVGILVGSLLIGSRFKELPIAGDILYSLTESLRAVENYVGLAGILVGILGLLNIHLMCW